MKRAIALHRANQKPSAKPKPAPTKPVATNVVDHWGGASHHYALQLLGLCWEKTRQG